MIGNTPMDIVDKFLLEGKSQPYKAEIFIINRTAYEISFLIKIKEAKSDGTSIKSGWAQFGFISRKAIDEIKKGESLFGRTIQSPRLSTSREILGFYKIVDKGELMGNGIFEYGIESLPKLKIPGLDGSWVLKRDTSDKFKLIKE